MPFPSGRLLKDAILLALDRGADGCAPSDLYAPLADRFGLTQAERDRKQPNGRNDWEQRVKWARQELTRDGLLDGSQRGRWRLTAAGRARTSGLFDDGQVGGGKPHRPGGLRPATGAEVGLRRQEQVRIALEAAESNGGSATMDEIVSAVNVEMEKRLAVLSDQGEATLREYVNRYAVDRGLLKRSADGKRAWEITDNGREWLRGNPGDGEPDAEDDVDGGGGAWSESELSAIIEDYFAMLRAELGGEEYSKTEHRRALLPRLAGRNDKAVEYKHCNVSAVLSERGLPYIEGYRPRGKYQRALGDAVDEFLARHPEYWDWDDVVGAAGATLGVGPAPEPYVEPPFAAIRGAVQQAGLRIEERTLRRYHLSVKSRGFVILSGVSGTGKSWLAREYADAVGGERCVVAVAPNWSTNEDLLGYFNPLSGNDGAYHNTDFSRFLRRAAAAYERATAAGVAPQPFHLVLDEMNLARVEYYFAKFLSAMEERGGGKEPELELGPHDRVILPPNLCFVGTVNIDETTHGFADKVFDRAQVIELPVSRQDLFDYIGDVPYRGALMDVWDAVSRVAPFAYRVAGEIGAYIQAAEREGVAWQEALDEQLLQKVLPKLSGVDTELGNALSRLVAMANGHFPLAHAKAVRMNDDFGRTGSASYF